MPEQWVRQPIRYKAEGRTPDLAVDINQQLYPKLLPFIQEYAAKNKLTITVTKVPAAVHRNARRRRSTSVPSCPRDSGPLAEATTRSGCTGGDRDPPRVRDSLP
jgi:hypothetical protein